jgi:Uroporphyrinogen decarboxylase (URO-D)
VTHRERWLRTFHFQSVDHVPDMEFGYWDEVFPIWHEQGLPEEIDSIAKADVYFGFAGLSFVPTHDSLLPPFEHRILEEGPDYRITQNGDGARFVEHTSGQSSIPHFLEFALKDRQTWERDFKPRLDPSNPARRDVAYADAHREEWARRDYPLGVGFGSLYGWIRNWAGFEGASMMVLDDPGLMEEIMEQITQTILRSVEWACAQAQLDFASGWEDMCFNMGPMISPRDFECLMVPRYKRITDVLHRHGCDIIFTDCDGNITHLVPLWLEAGINCMFPVEVAAGSDPVALRDTYGRQVLLMGGVNKRALIAGKEAIRKEVDRIAPYVREGGWIPHVDHRCPPDVTFENYLYYLKYKRETFGIPEPAPWEERRPATW